MANNCNPSFTGGAPGGASGKEPTCQHRDVKRCGFDPWVRKIPWRRKRQPTPVFLPGESRGQRSLAGYSPWGRTDSDKTEATEYAHTASVVSIFLVSLQSCPWAPAGTVAS